MNIILLLFSEDLSICCIEARISKEGIVTFNHYGDESIKELVRKGILNLNAEH